MATSATDAAAKLDDKSGNGAALVMPVVVKDKRVDWVPSMRLPEPVAACDSVPLTDTEVDQAAVVLRNFHFKRLLDIKATADSVREFATTVNEKGYVALHSVCSHDGTLPASHLRDDVEAARLLLRAGTPAMARTPNQWTPLHFAAGSKHIPLARLLLAQGVDPNAVCNTDATPLHIAAAANCGAMVRLLIVHGSDPRLSDWRGRTPVSYATAAEIRGMLQRVVTRMTHNARGVLNTMGLLVAQNRTVMKLDAANVKLEAAEQQLGLRRAPLNLDAPPSPYHTYRRVEAQDSMKAFRKGPHHRTPTVVMEPRVVLGSDRRADDPPTLLATTMAASLTPAELRLAATSMDGPATATAAGDDADTSTAVSAVDDAANSLSRTDLALNRSLQRGASALSVFPSPLCSTTASPGVPSPRAKQVAARRSRKPKSRYAAERNIGRGPGYHRLFSYNKPAFQLQRPIADGVRSAAALPDARSPVRTRASAAPAFHTPPRRAAWAVEAAGAASSPTASPGRRQPRAIMGGPLVPESSPVPHTLLRTSYVGDAAAVSPAPASPSHPVSTTPTRTSPSAVASPMVVPRSSSARLLPLTPKRSGGAGMPGAVASPVADVLASTAGLSSRWQQWAQASSPRTPTHALPTAALVPTATP